MIKLLQSVWVGVNFKGDLEHRSTESTMHAGLRPVSSTTTPRYPSLEVADGRSSASAGPNSRSGPRRGTAFQTPSMSRQLSDPQRTPTPAQFAQPDFPRASRKVRQDSATPPYPPRVPAVTPQMPTKRAKSLTACVCPVSISNQSRCRAPPVSQPRPNRDVSKRRAVGKYPVPADEHA